MPQFGKEEIANLTAVIESGVFCDKRGGFMDRFRTEFAAALGARHALTGGSAMLLMQAIPGAIGTGAGDEIIVDPVVQFHAIACLWNNIVPVWADVRPGDFLMDPDSAEAKITSRTRAIWVTHLWGFPAEVDRLRAIADKHGIYLLEDCAHILMGTYRGKPLGTWGHFGTFSFNMGKQLPTGEGGMAICNDDRLAFELDRRIIFGESPEVLSSNYRMTEFQAAVGVAQFAKVPGYLEVFRQGKKVLDDAIKGCAWLDPRTLLPGSVVAPYFWSCLFHGERAGIEHGVFKAAMRQAGDEYGFGLTQRPGYMYEMFRRPNAYGNRGCPYTCGHYTGVVEWNPGMCPVAEDVIPRIISTNNMSLDPAAYVKKAVVMKKAIALAESGNVEPLQYDERELRILDLVKERGPIEPIEAVGLFDEKGWEHIDEHRMLATMEGLRERYPRKLSHAGPRKFAYHELA
ncbi:MAG: DegT/DnrJ/EryC1/StrS family aminotransferase [Spirochaetia bacterium]|jgi:dTDP-4-amino-4,6-dideoxygalactose transaminase